MTFGFSQNSRWNNLKTRVQSRLLDHLQEDLSRWIRKSKGQMFLKISHKYLDISSIFYRKNQLNRSSRARVPQTQYFYDVSVIDDISLILPTFSQNFDRPIIDGRYYFEPHRYSIYL